MAGLCKDCGTRPKKPSRGNHFCAICSDHRKAKRLCRGCGGPKMKRRGAQYCESCDRVEMPKPCLKCGSPKLNPRPAQRYCADCEETRLWERRKKYEAKLIIRRMPCRGCGKAKGPGRRNYCSPCQEAKRTRLCGICQEHPVRGFRKKTCAECHRTAPDRERKARALYRERMRNDPVLAARQRESERRSHERAKMRIRASPGTAPPRLPRVLPARDLGLKIQEIAEGRGLPLEELCPILGVTERTVGAWARGERESVQIEKADRVLTNLDLLPWDVWDSQRYPETMVAFGHS